MSAYRIKGEDGVIIDSTNYLELPKGADSGRPTNPRLGMIRFNTTATNRGVEAVVLVESQGNQALEWRRIAHLDVDGKLLTSQLPSSITGSLTYKGTWDASINDVNETSADVDPPLDPLPAPTGKVGFYYIVRVEGDGGGAANLAPVPSAPGAKYKKGDWIVSNGATWEKVDQSQITTTAAQTQFSINAMRTAHNIKASVSLQDGLDNLVEHALDRYGDTMRGTLTIGTDAEARILLANGSAAKPNLSFVSDTNTGVYWEKADTISFSTGGAKRAELGNTALTSTVLIKAADGTAATPAFTFTSNDNTGIFKAAANVIGLTTSGVERARAYERGFQALAFDADQGSATDAAYAFKGDNNTGMYSPAAEQIAFANNSVNTLTLKQTELQSNVQIKNINGVVGAPAYSFSSDAKSGMWLSAPGVVQLSANGVGIINFDTNSVNFTVQSLHANGTLAAPGIAFVSDPNTGFARTAEGVIDVVSNGVKILSYGGNGITTNSVTKLIDGTEAVPALVFASDEDTGIYKSATGTFSISADATNVASFAKGLTTYNSIVQLLPGTAAEPGLRLSAEKTGLFQSANKLGVSVAGVERLAVSNASVSTNTKFAAPAGSAAAPSITFGNDTNTGLYSVAADQIGITTNGTVATIFTNTEVVNKIQVRIPMGTLATPGLVFDGDTNTGIFRDGAVAAEDNITFCANGAKVFQVTPTYTNPLAPVKLINGTVAAPSLCFDGDVKSGLYFAGGTVKTTIAGVDRLSVSAGSIVANTTVAIGTNPLTLAKSSIQSTADGTIQFKAEHASTPFTFGVGTTVYSSIGPGSILLPTGTTAARPTGVNGMIRYNNDIKNMEGFIDGSWEELGGSGKITKSGTATAPAVTFGDDLNTGLFSDAADTVSVSAGGVKQVTVATTGTTFTKPITINTGTGSITIGSENTAYNHFKGTKPAYFDQCVESVGGFKVYNKDTALQPDGKIMENGKLLEDKYVPFHPGPYSTLIPEGSVQMQNTARLLWNYNSDWAGISFLNTGDSDTNSHMLFETGDNGTEYFKFAHRMSGATNNITWMDIKSTGITVPGKSNTLGDWAFTDGSMDYKGNSVITVTPTGDVIFNGGAAGGASGATAAYYVATKSGGEDSVASFSGPGKGGSYATMYNRHATFHTNINQSGSSYAPIISAKYINNTTGMGMYSIGILDENAANAGKLVFHHINSAGGSSNNLSWDGEDGTLSTAVISSPRIVSNSVVITGDTPMVTFQDTNQRSAFAHVNSNQFYILRGAINGSTWDPGPNNRHPMTLNLETGDVVFSGDVTAFSDRRLKKDIVDIDSTTALSKVLKLQGVNYKRIGNDTDRVQCGFIAQDLQKVIPEVVHVQPDEDSTLTVDYAKMNAYLVEAIKEQQKQIETLYKLIDQLMQK